MSERVGVMVSAVLEETGNYEPNYIIYRPSINCVKKVAIPRTIFDQLVTLSRLEFRDNLRHKK